GDLVLVDGAGRAGVELVGGGGVRVVMDCGRCGNVGGGCGALGGGGGNALMDGTVGVPLAVRGLSKAYRRRPVLRAVELVVGSGEAVAIIGRNGAGKSTFLGCITGDRLPDEGKVRISGLDPFADPVAVAECIGFVPEQPFLYGELTIGETI